MPIISLTRREKIVIRVVLGLRYETTPAQLRAVLEDLRALLTADLRVYPESARARLINLGDSSLDIEVFAQLRTTDGVEFLGIQEELLLRMMDVIAEHGAALAFPSQTLYLGRDRDNDSIKAAGARAGRQRLDEGVTGTAPVGRAA